MIKFFRKIRQTYLWKTKLESILNTQLEKLLLVVIGIVIALVKHSMNRSEKEKTK